MFSGKEGCGPSCFNWVGSGIPLPNGELNSGVLILFLSACTGKPTPFQASGVSFRLMSRPLSTQSRIWERGDETKVRRTRAFTIIRRSGDISLSDPWAWRDFRVLSRDICTGTGVRSFRDLCTWVQSFEISILPVSAFWPLPLSPLETWL
jgi:hypothetical protein